MKLFKLSDILKVQNLSLKAIENPIGDYYVVKFNSPANLSWTPGEHGIFTLIGKKFKGRKWRIFSIANTPGDNEIVIVTRTGKDISNYKNSLINMQVGDIIKMNGPFGNFKLLDNSSPLVIFAGGVGISPIMAMVKSLSSEFNAPVHLIYSSDRYYLFEDELNELNIDNINIYKTRTTKENMLKIAELAQMYGSEAYYLSSGSKMAVNKIEKQLKFFGIDNDRILKDSFRGIDHVIEPLYNNFI